MREARTARRIVLAADAITDVDRNGRDAMILDDYKRQLAASRGPGRRLSKSVYGYLVAALVRTTPKVLLFGIDQGAIPRPLRDEQYAEDAWADALLRERSLLYVAATRARDELALSWNGDPSQLLPAAQQD